MGHSHANLRAVLQAIDESIGARETWVRYPGGYPEEVEAALLDAVFSLRATMELLLLSGRGPW